MLVAGVCFVPVLGCRAVGWRLWVAWLVCLFMRVLQGLVAVGWPVVLVLVDYAGRMVVGKYIFMVVWDCRWLDLLVRAG